MATIEPCPFCGGLAVLEKETTPDGAILRFLVQCRECGASGPKCGVRVVGHQTEIVAASVAARAKWNERGWAMNEDKHGIPWDRPETRRERFARWWSCFAIGVECRKVTFADHRSGTSALRITLSLGWWSWAFYPVKWPSRRAMVGYRTLIEIIEAVHGHASEEEE